MQPRSISRFGHRRHFLVLCCLWAALSGLPTAHGQDLAPLNGTAPLLLQGDFSALMVQGIDKFLVRETDQSVAARAARWNRKFTSPADYELSIAPNRERFRAIIGAVDPRVSPVTMEYLSTTDTPAKVAETSAFTAYAVRWPALENVYGEGLWLVPKGTVRASVIAIPDADQTPEMLVGLAPGIRPESQFARHLAENGCQVIVPMLLSREDTWSGNEALGRLTNQPHREWIYRQAYELGRHIIGYEVQKVLAAVDWCATENARNTKGSTVPIGVVGYGEGGLLAFYSAALDPRIGSALVSGYFGSRERVWEEPIYRNVFGLLTEFGDAEIAGMIAPRGLIVEYSEGPRVAGPPPARPGRGGAAPGKLSTSDRIVVETEINRAREFFPAAFGFEPDLVYANEGQTIPAGSTGALASFLQSLKAGNTVAPQATNVVTDARKGFSASERQKRQLDELVRYTQRLLLLCERARETSFWGTVRSAKTNDWADVAGMHKSNLWENVLGRFPPASSPIHARSRRILEKEKWTGYDVMLDVWPDVFAWGVLLLPKDLKPGERRPVVVCQHGLEGVPMDTIDDDPKNRAYGFYKAYAARLAERGYVVFAPHNPYRGEDRFRVLQRKANPLGKSLYSVILAQHERILDWLTAQPYVDPSRIAFYGLSYGGKTAMRVPPLLDRYCLAICSADFNDWVKKISTTETAFSYVFSGEYEMPEFNLGYTYNYAEMAALMAPRPFMVERGHHDGVASDEWVAYEFAKVRRWYAHLQIPDRTTIEFFDGPHTINGKGTFDFLQTHLRWNVAAP